MIFAAINWLSISINLLLVVFVIVCLLMALLILMQRPKQEGLGAAFGGGVTDQVFGARTTNVLQKGTVYLGSLFFLLSLTLAILIGKQTQQKSLLTPEKTVVEGKSDAADSSETAKASVEVPKSLADELPTEDAPAAPDAKVEEVKQEAAAAVEEAAPKVEEKVDAAVEKAEEVTEPAVEENKEDKPE